MNLCPEIKVTENQIHDSLCSVQKYRLLFEEVDPTNTKVRQLAMELLELEWYLCRAAEQIQLLREGNSTLPTESLQELVSKLAVCPQ